MIAASRSSRCLTSSWCSSNGIFTGYRTDAPHPEPEDWDGESEHLEGIELGDKATRDNYGRQLQSIGYYYDPDDEVALRDTVAIFRSRWKKRVNRRWRSILKANVLRLLSNK